MYSLMWLEGPLKGDEISLSSQANNRVGVWATQSDEHLTYQFLFGQNFPQFLTSNKINYIGIGKPEYVPYGRAAIEVLKSLKVIKEISPKFVLGKSVNQVFLMSFFGNLDLGFVSKAYFLSNNEKGKIWEIPQNLYSPIKQDAILLKYGEKKNNAILFLKFLSSERTKEDLKRFGYVFD